MDGPKPDVWTPASSGWIAMLQRRAADNDRASLVSADNPSIATTPLVIAMPKPMAEALGWPDKPIGWSDILSLAQDPQGWAKYGHPEWGAFRLGKTNPNFSTSGLNATIGTYFAATGTLRATSRRRTSRTDGPRVRQRRRVGRSSTTATPR